MRSDISPTGPLQADPGLRGWADVYYFCSSSAADTPFCTCDMKWSWMGYLKFSVPPPPPPPPQPPPVDRPAAELPGASCPNGFNRRYSMMRLS